MAMTEEVRRLIAEGLERVVAVVCFLTAGRLEGPVEVNEDNPKLNQLTIRCCVNTFLEFCQ